jgi:choline dehydrogenase-like flavoprotein
MLSKPTNDAPVVVGSGAHGSWAVTELAEGGKKSVMFEAGANPGVANDFRADAQEVGGN